MRLVPMIVFLSILALMGRIISVYTEINPTFTGSALAFEASPQETSDESQPEQSPAQQDEKAEDSKPDDEKQAAPSTPPQSLPTTAGLDFTNFATCTEEDIRLVDQLRQRRLVLEKRAEELDIRENLLAATEVRIQESTAQLVELEQQIKSHLKLFDERERKQVERIVQVYSAMKAKDAAPRFEQLDIEIQVDLATVMKPKVVADIIAKMTNAKAAELTTRLATVAAAPTIEDVRGSR